MQTSYQPPRTYDTLLRRLPGKQMMSLSNELKVLVLGAGDRGKAHAKVWQEMQDAAVVAVVDSDIERATKLAEELGVARASNDFDAAIRSTDADIVSVGLPTFLHPQATILAAEHGKHIFCEKPVALTLEDADRMAEAVKFNGVQFALCFQRRAWANVGELRKRLLDGEIGRPVMARSVSAIEIRPKRLMHDKHGNGGPVVDGLCHYFDMWRWMFDSEPVRVCAGGMIFGKGKPELAHIAELAIDTAAIVVEFASGDIGMATWSWGLPPGMSLPGLEDSIGPAGAMTTSAGKLRILKQGNNETVVEFPYAEGTDVLASRFIEAIRTGIPMSPTLEDGKRATAISLAALESIESGQSVEM